MKYKSTIMVIVFVIGSIVGGAFTSIFLCHCPDKLVAYPPTYEKLGIKKANSYFRSYNINPLTVEHFRGYTISRDCYQKMKDLDTDIHGNCDGFRLYMGNDGVSDVIMIVPTAAGSDLIKENFIYSLSRKGTGPCPTVCDEQSPVTKP